MARRADAFAAFHLLARLVFEPLAYDRVGPRNAQPMATNSKLSFCWGRTGRGCNYLVRLRLYPNHVEIWARTVSIVGAKPVIIERVRSQADNVVTSRIA